MRVVITTRMRFLRIAPALLFACAGAEPPQTIPIPPKVVAQAPDAALALPSAAPLAYPPARRGTDADTLFGVKVPDPYRWLEDAKSDDVQKWMTDEDTFARDRLAKLPGRDAIAARLRELFYIDSLGIPSHRGTRYFYSRRLATKEKPIVYYREGKAGEERLLLDPNAWSSDTKNVSLGGWWPSWDGKKVAYTIKPNNSDESDLYVMDVATGKNDVDVIHGAKYAHASWTPKSDGFYYTWLPPPDPNVPASDRPGLADVRFHKLGQDGAKDTLIHEKTGDPKSFISVDLSQDGRWLFVAISHGWTRNDLYFKDIKAGDKAWRPLVVGIDAEFDVDAYKDRFYVRTNDGAPKYRIFKVDPAQAERAKWQEIVPENKDATLRGTAIVGGRLSLGYLKDVVSKVEVRETDGKLVREIALPTLGTASMLYGREDEDEAYYSFTSFTYPTEIYETSVKKGPTVRAESTADSPKGTLKDKLWFRLKIPVDPSRYAVEQIFATSKDGTKIPIFVVRPKDLGKDGSAPAILFGYGGFRSSQTPAFQASMYPWLERGAVYAIANLRGGSEYGEDWHRAGMRTHKQNVFDDFAAAAEELVKAGYTKPDRLALRGGSNGGLLVGTLVTQHPELFKVALCSVPLLDMVRYHRFESGKTWIEELGSADDETDFRSLFSYSPYHHVKAGTKYPSVLLLSADHDDRVDPMHARKFAAALQSATSGGPVLLRIERNSGHGGADMVKSNVERIADELAFALSEMGVSPPAWQ
jgi:prolyl oligopeptidase